MSRWWGVLAVMAAVAAVSLFFVVASRLSGRATSGAASPLPGARGRLAFVRDGDLWVYDLLRGTERRLTREGGVSRPRWSGGGTWLSFERHGRLWAMPASGGGPIPVPGGDRPATAQWAPRAARLAYASTDGSLRLFEPAQNEREARALVPAGSNVGDRIAWSPGGDRLAYERHDPIAPGLSNEGIWTIPSSGRDPAPLYVASGPFTLALCCYTASGSYVLFWQRGGAGSIPDDGLPLYLAHVSGTRPIQVSLAVPLERGWIDPAPLSDGIAVVAGAGRMATAGKTLLVASLLPESGRLRTATLVDDLDRAPAWPAWSPRGDVVAYSDGPSLTVAGGDLAASLASRRIWLSRADGSGRQPLLPEATVPEGVSDERPIWARDGRSIIFARRLQPEVAVRMASEPAGTGVASGVELWVALADGTAARRITGGLTDPGIGRAGILDWTFLFDYHRG